MAAPEITIDIAKKVLATIDAGLVKGVGKPVPGQMCVEAAVCYAMGLPHSDDPICVSRALRRLKIRLNDANWSSDAARANGLRRLGLAQLGSRDVLDDKEFARRVAELSIRKQLPIALRAAASVQRDTKHQEALMAAAKRCEKEGSRQSALDAQAAAYAAYVAADAADAAYAAYAYAYAYADADAADAADAAAAAVAAYAAAAAKKSKAAWRDEVLSDFAEDVVQILIDMKAPGCQWLALTEQQSA